MTKEELKPCNSNDNKVLLIEAIVYLNDENNQLSTAIVLGVFPSDFAAINACKNKLKKDKNLIAYTTRPTRTQNSI